MRTKKLPPTGISTSIPRDAVRDEIVRQCRGAHRWRVTSFSLRERTIGEKCTACGLERTKGW